MLILKSRLWKKYFTKFFKKSLFASLHTGIKPLGLEGRDIIFFTFRQLNSIVYKIIKSKAFKILNLKWVWLAYIRKADYFFYLDGVFSFTEISFIFQWLFSSDYVYTLSLNIWMLGVCKSLICCCDLINIVLEINTLLFKVVNSVKIYIILLLGLVN